MPTFLFLLPSNFLDSVVKIINTINTTSKTGTIMIMFSEIGPSIKGFIKNEQSKIVIIPEINSARSFLSQVQNVLLI